ncbi:hypothetical protein OAU33_01715 [Flavobacteriaceae bacterium]|nr:hypothetical protein [Flavobacteriaceae bacterium]
MKKYEYKMIMRDNETVWKEVGIQGSGWSSKNSEEPVSMGFCNVLGQEGFEMFQVVHYALNSCYYFRKEL